MRFGYSSNIGEITPNIFLGLSKKARIYNFLILYNSCVKTQLQIPLAYASKENIKIAFLAYIDNLLQVNSIKKYKLKNICLTSNAFIDAYKSRNFNMISKIATEPKYKIAKLIKMLYASGEFELIFDANFMFSQFVYDKIRGRNFDKNVYFQDDVIVIEQNGKQKLCIMPSFKNFSPENSYRISKEIDYAVNFLQNNECGSFYVVMPRNSEFKRHIQVRHCGCLNKHIKLVPYMIR